MKNRVRVLFGVLALALSGCSADDWRSVAGAEAEPPPSPVELEQSQTEPPHSDLSAIVEEALPSVVNVKVVSVALSEGAAPLEGRGEGSGVVIDRNGVILTNYHVVEGAVSVRIVFTTDRKPLEGRVVGADPERDLAVVRVEADDLDPLPLGSSNRMKLGDDVVAIGFPLGLGGPTVTRGIVSGVDREISAQADSTGRIENLVGLLQTDAAINPGNSGGALINMRGELVGINTAVAGEAENIGFAIAIDSALAVIDEILNEPLERQAWLGVQLGSIDSSFSAGELGLPSDTRGAVIIGVVPRSPALGAGLEQGEVITGINGEPIASADELIEVLTEVDPGTSVRLDVLSPAGERTVSVTLEQKPFDFLTEDD